MDDFCFDPLSGVDEQHFSEEGGQLFGVPHFKDVQVFLHLHFIESVLRGEAVEFGAIFEGACFEDGESDAEHFALIFEAVAEGTQIFPFVFFFNLFRSYIVI